SFAILLRRACDSLIERLDSTRSAFRKRIEEHRRTPMIGRSHGIHAEPITFGLMLSSHLAELDRSRRHLHRAREEISVGKIAGAVGTYAHLTPEIESDALQQLDLAAETCATQIVARDRHASFFCALGVLASAIERFAVNIRHAQRTEVGEAEEAFAVGQKGSSAMPHKRNPVLSENLTGLARTVRMTVIPALENVALWHERDISHSSVERMIAPDATSTMAFALDRLHRLVEHLVVYPDRLANNLERSGGLWASEGVLLLLVSAGLPRQKSYELVQRNAMRAFHGEGDFKTLLAEDEDLMKHISFEELEQQFDLEHALRYVDPIIDRTLSASNPE
ncbi:MAG: adenylosuccinate lyase, partial [Myxococcota bacterium]